MNWRAVVLCAGAGLAALVILTLVSPDLLDLGVGRITVILVAVVALLQALHLVNVRRHADFVRERTPAPERRYPATPPGDELHEALYQFRREPRAFYQMSGRRGLTVAAVAALTRYEGLAREEAERRIEEGTWTDDPKAARFLQTSGPSVSRPLDWWLGSDFGRENGVERCIEAIAAVADVPTGSDRTDGKQPPDRVDSTREETAPSTATPGRTGRLARRETNRWRGISVAVLAAVGVGVVLEEPAILLVGVVGLAYAAYARSGDPGPVELSVERSIADDQPDPGDAVEVSVRLTNDGSATLPDVRVLDGVPSALAVAEGSPRQGTALRPGETVEWTYAVTSRRGVHEFDPALVLVRDAPGAVELVHGVAADGATRLTCIPPLQTLPVPVPLRGANTHYTGRQPTPASGDGTEFFATRRYQHGDDVSRIDWNRRAKTGELSTVLFREERMATVVLLVDTNPASYVSPDPDGDHAVDRSVTAAGRAYLSLASHGHVVGIASMTDPDCWLEPGNGQSHRARARELLATHPALSSVPPADEERKLPVRARQTVRRRLPTGAQVFVFSPLARRSVVRFVRRLEAAGHPVTVVSPDATADGTPSQQLARVGRQVHVTDLRRDGIPVLDWAWEESLTDALVRFETEVASR